MEVQIKNQRPPENGYLEKLLKLIPTEIVAVYATLITFIPKELVPNLIVSLLLLILTPFYLILGLNVKNKSQITISTIAFIVWVFYLGGPFYYLQWYQNQDWLRGTSLIIFSLIPPIFLNKRRIQSKVEFKEKHKRRNYIKNLSSEDQVKEMLGNDISNARQVQVVMYDPTKSWREI